MHTHYTHTPFIFVILSINVDNYIGQLWCGQSNSTRYPHSTGHLGRWVICLQLSAVFELCCWPVPQMLPYALDQSPSLLSLCEGAVQFTITSIAAEKKIAPHLKCQFIVPTLSHLIKIQSLTPRLKLAFHFD